MGESLVITAALAWGVSLAGRERSGVVMAWVGIAMYGALALGAPLVAWAVYDWTQRRKWDEHKLTPLFLGSGVYGLIMVGLIEWGAQQGG